MHNYQILLTYEWSLMEENSTVERKIAYFHYSLSFNYLKKRRFKRIMSTKIYFSFCLQRPPNDNCYQNNL